MVTYYLSNPLYVGAENLSLYQHHIVTICWSSILLITSLVLITVCLTQDKAHLQGLQRAIK